MVFDCSGSHYEMGLEQGRALKDNILDTHSRFFNLDFIRQFIPGDYMAGSLGAFAYSFLMKSLQEFDPPTFERIRGLSDSLGIEVNKILFLQFFESLISSPFITTSACTTGIIDSKRNLANTPLLIKDYDLFTELAASTVLRRSSPKSRLKSLELIISPLTGSHLGVNEAGLCVSYNYGMVKSFFKKFLPPTLLCQYALENFSRTRQVLDFIAKVGSANGAIFTILDETGDGAMVEALGKDMAVRRAVGGLLSASNIFVHSDMKKFNYKDTDKYNQFGPKGYHDFLINESCNKRFARMDELLKSGGTFGKFGRRDLKRILRDHGGQKEGDDNTVCRHHEVISTLAGAIVSPKDRTMEIAFGNPCENKFKLYRL